MRTGRLHVLVTGAAGSGPMCDSGAALAPIVDALNQVLPGRQSRLFLCAYRSSVTAATLIGGSCSVA